MRLLMTDCYVSTAGTKLPCNCQLQPPTGAGATALERFFPSNASLLRNYRNVMPVPWPTGPACFPDPSIATRYWYRSPSPPAPAHKAHRVDLSRPASVSLYSTLPVPAPAGINQCPRLKKIQSVPQQASRHPAAHPIFPAHWNTPCGAIVMHHHHAIQRLSVTGYPAPFAATSPQASHPLPPGQ